MTEPTERLLPVQWYRRADVVGGLLICGIAATIWFGSAGLQVGSLRHFGAGFLPRIFALSLLAGGLLLVLRGLRQEARAAVPLVMAARGPMMIGLAILVFATTLRGMTLGPVVVPGLGLIVAGTATVVIAGLASPEGRPRELLVLGLAMSGLLAVVFAEFLSVQIPVAPPFVTRALPVEWGYNLPRRVATVLSLVAAAGLWWLMLRPAHAGGRP